eukprot:COSAG01_NODE_25090_length_755_cov_0.966514_2_plen_74_part_01
MGGVLCHRERIAGQEDLDAPPPFSPGAGAWAAGYPAFPLKKSPGAPPPPPLWGGKFGGGGGKGGASENCKKGAR